MGGRHEPMLFRMYAPAGHQFLAHPVDHPGRVWEDGVWLWLEAGRLEMLCGGGPGPSFDGAIGGGRVFPGVPRPAGSSGRTGGRPAGKPGTGSQPDPGW